MVMEGLHTIDPVDMRAPEVGEKVDDFALESTRGIFRLSERVRDGPVLLYFYVIDFGKTCTDYIALMNERVRDLQNLGVTMVHVNDDTVVNHQDCAEAEPDFFVTGIRPPSVQSYYTCLRV